MRFPADRAIWIEESAMNQNKQSLWEQCVTFHGHACGGLAVGYQASLYAMELLEIERAADEELVCVAECDACGVDAIQSLLGCTLGKGNLILKPYGKQAFSFYHRHTGRSVRLVLRATPERTKAEREQWLMTGDYHEMFDCKKAPSDIPERARIFETYICSKCGERAAENHIHLEHGAYVCEACYVPYQRRI